MFKVVGKSTNTARIPVDQQPASFEENHQFRIFHRFIGIPNNHDIVFKFTATNPVNIMERKINLWSGGREYLVIPDNGSYGALDALLTTPVTVWTVNGNLEDSGYATHPDSGVTVIMSSGIGLAAPFGVTDLSQYPNGDAVQTDGNANRANNSLLAAPNMSGVSRNQSFYLFFRGIGNNNALTSGHFTVQVEARL